MDDCQFELDQVEVANNKLIRVSYDREINFAFGVKQLDDNFYLFDDGCWKLSSLEEMFKIMDELDLHTKYFDRLDHQHDDNLVRLAYRVWTFQDNKLYNGYKQIKDEWYFLNNTGKWELSDKETVRNIMTNFMI